MSEKKITLYAKKFGCQPCNMTKKAFLKTGIVETVDGELASTVDGVEFETVYLDQPENSETLQILKEQGLAAAPVVMVNFPVSVNGEIVDHWTGLQPDAIKATATTVKA